MKKILFIINPISGVANKVDIEKLIVNELGNLYECYFGRTQFPGHASKITKDFIGKVDIITAIGGDGTVREVGQCLVHTDTALAILPAGSGNGFARSLNIPTKLTDAVRMLKTHQVKLVDTALINNEICMGIMGIGFDAHISNCFNSLKRRGFASYIKLIIHEFFQFSPIDISVEIDGILHKKNNTFLMSISNSGEYGNGAKICPTSVMDDGYLEAVFLKKPNVLEIPGLIIKIFTGRFHHSNLTETIQGKRFIIKNNFNLFHSDGEPLTSQSPLEIKVNPLSLKVVIMKNE